MMGIDCDGATGPAFPLIDHVALTHEIGAMMISTPISSAFVRQMLLMISLMLPPICA